MSGGRLIAVFGYSDRSTDALHPICAARLERAMRESQADDVVLLSGWARWRKPVSEAELMSRAWNGQTARLVLDHDARTTLGNACRTAETLRELGLREVVLVSSSWHLRRASSLLRAALRNVDADVTTAAADDRASLRTRARELVAWTLVPVFAAFAARSR
jgi:vancomycin permeability regulator SanA